MKVDGEVAVGGMDEARVEGEAVDRPLIPRAAVYGCDRQIHSAFYGRQRRCNSHKSMRKSYSGGERQYIK